MNEKNDAECALDVARMALEAAGATGMWDQAPMLLWLVRDVESADPYVVHFNVGDDTWNTRPAPEVLEALPGALLTAAAAVGLPPSLSVGRVFGVLFVCEVWARFGEGALPGPDDDDMPASGSLADDPRAVEARIVTGVCLDGSDLHAVHTRGDELPEVYASGDGTFTTGRVPEALIALLDAMVSIQMAAAS